MAKCRDTPDTLERFDAVDAGKGDVQFSGSFVIFTVLKRLALFLDAWFWWVFHLICILDRPYFLLITLSRSNNLKIEYRLVLWKYWLKPRFCELTYLLHLNTKKLIPTTSRILETMYDIFESTVYNSLNIFIVYCSVKSVNYHCFMRINESNSHILGENQWNYLFLGKRSYQA